MSNYLKEFPQGFSPNESQIDILTQIEQEFSKGTKFVIVSAPTGSGKSFLSKTIGNVSRQPTKEYEQLITSYAAFEQNYLGEYVNQEQCLKQTPHGVFILTITKSLQEQYIDMFSDAMSSKGKSNYDCELDANFTVETAPCVLTPSLKRGCWGNCICPYYEARNKALVSRFGVLNYKMFLSLPEHVKRRQFIVCDESAELEDELVKMYSAELSYKRLKSVGIEVTPLHTEVYDKAGIWLSNLLLDINDEVSDLVDRVSKKKSGAGFTPFEQGKLTYLKNLQNSLQGVCTNWTATEFIIDRAAESVSFTPLKVDMLSKNVFQYAEHVLLMSATIIDHKQYAKSLGIDNYKYIEAKSTFDPKKSPIYVSSKVKLNYGNLKDNLPSLTDKIKKICEHHKDEKGIIHTHTQYIANFIKDRLESDERFLFRSENDRNEVILLTHFESPNPTVLVSPSLTHGIDLKGDLARFQIIVKIPYLPLSQKRIKRLFDSDSDWYENKMLNSLVQASGRATRNTEDHSITYILDGGIVGVLQRAKHKLPQHFLDRFF